MRTNAFDAAKAEIEGYFDRSPKKSFTEKALEIVLKQNQLPWNIPQSKTVENFITFLEKRSKMTLSVLHRVDNNRELKLYTWITTDPLTTFMGLKNGAYYTHYTAMFQHGLTEQIPKTYYLNAEHSGYQLKRESDLKQENVDKAFEKEQRKTGEQFSYGPSTIVLLNGQYCDRLGVIEHREGAIRYSYTDITRTIIDISIRPAYSGGVLEVLKAYENVKEKLDPNKLRAYLNQMRFVYPYNQVIGFYLEKAGYPENTLRLFEETANIKFYLTYNMRNPRFNERWKLYYPRGM
jgi:hypothetical protein